MTDDEKGLITEMWDRKPCEIWRDDDGELAILDVTGQFSIILNAKGEADLLKFLLDSRADNPCNVDPNAQPSEGEKS